VEMTLNPVISSVRVNTLRIKFGKRFQARIGGRPLGLVTAIGGQPSSPEPFRFKTRFF